MKHGIAFRKFSRTSSHRMLMLRNLVTSLFEHEQIKTTLPKARDTARLAEKIITLAKKGNLSAQQRAGSFILKPEVMPKLFGSFAQRYSARPGGYTRIHKFGTRQGDNAPHAILELVDNPRDLKMEMTSRAIGWEMLTENLKRQQPMSLLKKGLKGTDDWLESERALEYGEKGKLRPKTRWNLQKVLRYRDTSEVETMGKKVGDYIDTLLATPEAFKALHKTLNKETSEGTETADKSKEKPTPLARPRPRVGQIIPGETRSALEMVKGSTVQPRRVLRKWQTKEVTPRLLTSYR